MTPSVSLVIPAHNEERSIGALLAECLPELRRLGADFDVTVVDDGSTDGTRGVVREWMASCPGQVFLAAHETRKGLAQAVETAFHCGKKESVLLLHADGQYPASAIGECLALIADADAVVLVRRRKFYGPWRHALSAGYRWLPAALFGVDLRDPGGAKCLRRSVIDGVHPVSRGVFRDPERVIRTVKRGGRVAFVPVDIRPRVAGVASGGRVGYALRSLADVGVLWWRTSVRREPW